MRYRYEGSAPVFLPMLHAIFAPGDECESTGEIRNRDFVPIKGPVIPAREDT